MFKIRIVYFCLLASMFLCSNALPAEKKGGSNFQLHGQVFIVTKGQQTFKLPLVQVFAVPESIISKVIASRIATRKEFLLSITPQLNEKKQAMDQASAEAKTRSDVSDALLRQGKEFLDKCAVLRSMEFDTCLKDYANFKVRRDEALEEVKNEAGPYYARSGAANREYENLANVDKEQRDAFKSLDGIESDIATTSKIVKTDADGNFSLANLQGKRIALFARAKRQVIGETEDYIWLIWADKTNTNIMLSNDNLIDSKCPECIRFLDGIE